MKRIIFILSFLSVLFGLFWVLSEMKTEAKSTEHYHISNPQIFYKL
jgi:hypothetical protein